MDCYEWFDPHEVRAKIPALERKASDSFSSGVYAGQEQSRRFMGGHVGDAIRKASSELGRSVVRQPEFIEALRLLTDGLQNNSDFEVRYETRPETMAEIVIQSIQVRPFRVSYGASFSRHDLQDRRFA